MNNRYSLKIIIIFTFLIVYGLFFTIASIDKNSRVDVILQEHIEKLNTQYNIIQNYFFIDALALKGVIQKDKNIQRIFKESQSALPIQRDSLREELHEYLTPLYTRVLKRGVFQLQFVYGDNTSFMRMHKIDKYGDDLSDIRHSFVYVNSQKKDIWGFEQGRTTHAFRYVFPFYDEDGNYLGAVETSLSSNFIQNKLVKASKLHTHFLVNKKIFHAKTWSTKHLINNYIPSIEHKNYMYSIVDEIHTDKKNRLERDFLEPLQEKIVKKMAFKKPFAIYHNIENSVKVVSFLPVRNIKDKKVVAYLVSYSDDNNIYEIQTHFIVLVVGMFFIFIFLTYFVYVNLRASEELKIYEKIISLTKSHMSFLDTDYVYKAVNNMYLTVHNKSKNEILGHTVLELFGKELYEDVIKEKLDQCLAGQEIHYSDWFETEGTGLVYMEISFYNYVVKGVVKGIVVSSNDITKLHLTQEKLKELANKDQLTNLYNRRYFYDVVEKIISIAKREKTSVTVLMIDIDKFKNVNDTYGHGNGDEVIKSLATLLMEHTRESDIVARIGGEEFVVLLPNTTKESALKFANKLRLLTQELVISTQDGYSIKFTISIGVNSVDLENEKTIEQALIRADKALYKAKNSGRNRVC